MYQQLCWGAVEMCIQKREQANNNESCHSWQASVEATEVVNDDVVVDLLLKPLSTASYSRGQASEKQHGKHAA